MERTVNNLFIGNNVLQNNLNAARNLYNFFDFNNVESGRRITSIKYGWGAKSGTHLYLGVLHGYGKTSYLDSISTTKEHNVVGEVDAQWTINKTNHLAFSYGRSYIQADQINNTEQSAITASFFDFTHRSNAALLNYKLELPKTRTEVSVSGRLVDPFFKSLGLGFMRSDNLRYEGRLKQRIGKTFKLSGFYRRERDNLLAMYDFNNVLMSYGVGAELKIKRSGFAKVDLRPVVHSMDTGVDSLDFQNNNLILNAVANYRIRIKKDNYLTTTAIYAYYKLYNGEENHTYQNFNVNLQASVKDKWLVNANYNQYTSTDTSIIPLTGLADLSLEYIRNKWSLKGGGKMAVPGENGEPLQWGYLLGIRSKLFKRTELELTAERLVIGDFYSSVLLDNVLAYPYNFKAIISIQI